LQNVKFPAGNLKQDDRPVDTRLMAPATGWYPDPAGTAQLRFWDGQSWTNSTMPIPQAPQSAPQPAYSSSPAAAPLGTQEFATQQYAPQGYGQQQYAPQPNHSTPAQPQPRYANYPGHRPPGRGKRFYALVAGGVAAVVVIATVVPLALSSDPHPKPPPTKAAFTAVLLTVNEVDATTGGRFTVGPLSDDGSDDNSDDCKDVGNAPDPSTDSTSSAERTFTDSSQGNVADESLDYLPGKAAAAVAGLKKSAASCHTLTLDGDKVAVTVLPAPSVPHSDDTFAMQMAGTTSGHALTIEITVARFGDSLVTLVYGGLATPTSAQAAATALLVQASAKTQTVI
jgi:hypothetical protein